MSDSLLVDLDGGLKRVGGNLNLYKKLLVKYMNGTYIGDLETCVAEGNKDGALNAAHTVKGVAANLSLNAVSAAALAIEQAIKHDEPFTTLMEELKTTHLSTIDEIHRLDLA